jgi:carbon-monoxide dehydrogenase large subunit
VVVNAVVDALAGYGVTHIELPVTSERVWRAMREASPLPACGESKKREARGTR